jgi:hypothetical protein
MKKYWSVFTFLILVSLENDLGIKMVSQELIHDVAKTIVSLPTADYVGNDRGFLSVDVKRRPDQNYFFYSSNAAELWSTYSSIDS